MRPLSIRPFYHDDIEFMASTIAGDGSESVLSNMARQDTLAIVVFTFMPLIAVGVIP